MRSGRVALVRFQNTFTGTGTYDPYLNVDTQKPWPLAVSPFLWSLQVVGYNGATPPVVTAPSAWDVLLLGSNDGVNFTDLSLLVEHVNTAQGNGDVTWTNNGSATAPGQFRGVKFVRLKCKTLTLGSATKIVVFAEGY